MTTPNQSLILRIRLVLLFFISALIFSGVTAIPLEWEMDLLADMWDVDTSIAPEEYEGMQFWIAWVHEGVYVAANDYPFLQYGTDWLAFAHVMIAVAFIGPMRDPVKNAWVVDWGLICCVCVFPVAFIFGAIRGVPFFHQLIDCSFGFFGGLTLLPVRVWIRRLEKSAG